MKRIMGMKNEDWRECERNIIKNEKHKLIKTIRKKNTKEHKY